MPKRKSVGMFAAFFFMLLQSFALAGCGDEKDVDPVTNLKIDKNGGVTSTIVEAFNREFYTLDGLLEMIEAELASYNDSAEPAITLQGGELTETEEEVLITLYYASCKDYEDFNDVELFFGTVAEAQAAGYDLNVKLIDATGKGNDIGKEELLTMPNSRILIVRQSAQVSQIILPAKVLYFSEGTQLLNSRIVSLPQGGEEQDVTWKGELTYVVIK